MLADPGILVKIFRLGHSGELISPVHGTVWRSPLLRADRFCASPRIADAPGLHAWRFGLVADPTHWYTVIAHCRIPPGCRAVMSPWAVRAEALLVERLVVRRALAGSEMYDALRRIWGVHCDISLRGRGRYVAVHDPMGFRWRDRQRRRWVWAVAGALSWECGQRYAHIWADALRGVVLRRWYPHRRTARGDGRTRCRIERAIHRWYEQGDAVARDILLPWLRYFEQIHTGEAL